jgi:uncharacterized protein (TIGR02646 family)
VVRENLDSDTADDLARRQTEADRQRADGQLDVNSAWTSARKSAAFRPALAALRRMAGDTERCMYCLDSHGTDVEHFWPKSPYPERMFAWTNLLLGCAECGRLKGDRFPLDSGAPLLVDPSAEDPWEHLDFDSDTGNLMARVDRASGEPSRKGATTVDLLQLDAREALSNVYKRTFRRLRAEVDAALDAARGVGAPDGAALLDRLQAADDHGLLAWCFSERGARHPSFDRLRRELPDTWNAGVARFAPIVAQP